MQEGDDQERERERDQGRKDRVEDLRQRLLAEGADGQARRRHAELHRRDEPRRVGDDLEHVACTPVALLLELADTRLPRRHEPVLRRDEERVQQDQRRNGEEFEKESHVIAPSGGRLGMSSSSNWIYASV